jgi:hypothetical protein
LYIILYQVSLFRGNSQLSAVSNTNLLDQLESQNSQLVDKLKYIAQLEMQVDQLQMRCTRLDQLRLQATTNTTTEHQHSLEEDLVLSNGSRRDQAKFKE